MARLGFRPPQFSEDFAWLPPWLQHPQLQSSSPPSANQEFNGFVDNGKDVEILSIEEEGRNYYNNCHLFLSGEDTKSQHSITPSPGNVLNLRLHLSSDNDSQYSQSQLLHRTPRLDSSKALSLKQVETSGGPGEACQSKIDHDGGGVISPLTSARIPMENADSQSPTEKDCWRQYKGKIGQNVSCRMHYSPPSSIPTAAENAGPPSATNYKDSGCQYEETCNARHIKDSDISDAVELSISASEALVIHKFMMTGSSSDALAKQGILEAALFIKQARLAASEDAFGCPSDEVDEIDSLSDLDDSIMVDAFLDVGLSFSACGDEHLHELDVSQVEDTPVLENHQLDKGSEYVQLPLQQKIVDDDSDLVLYPSGEACLGDRILPQSAEKISQSSSVFVYTKAGNLGLPALDVNLSHACNEENAEGDPKVHYSVADRFRSRWLGGWALESCKEGDASAKLKQNSPKSIPKFFVGETSFLSESADVAPDENSFVKKHEMRSNIGSQSSVPFEALHDKADEGILISQEVRSSDLSLVDPLCSVVPCSISLENTGSPSARNGRNIDAENCFSPNTDIGMESFQKTSHQKIKSVYMDSESVPIIMGKCSDAPLRRKIASLRTYSTLLPNCDATLKREGPCHNRWFSSGHDRNLLSSHHEMGCIRSSDRRNSKGVLTFKSVFESTVGRDNEENQDVTIMRNLVAETTSQKRSHDQPTKYRAMMKVKPPVQRRSPLILNRRTRCRQQASELFAHNLTGGKSSNQTVEQENIINLCPRKNVENIQLKLKNSFGALNPVSKRVCFSEVEYDLYQNKDIQKPQTLHRNGSTLRANKKKKYCNTCSEFRTQDVKSCFTSQIKDVKRLIFHGLEFLLTGFSHKKEKEIVELIQIYGGMILLDIPSTPNSRLKQVSRSNLQDIPVVICSKKLQTTKFLYGCAVNALILNLKWLTDSVAAGSVVSPDKYMIISNQAYLKCTRIGKSVCCDHRKHIFDRVGILLHGKHRFCSKLAAIVKHAGGQVFKTLQSLVDSIDSEKISMGAIVAENESWALRHLRHCASESKITMMPARWIAKSLLLGKLLPFREEEKIPSAIEVPKCTTSMDWSQEI